MLVDILTRGHHYELVMRLSTTTDGDVNSCCMLTGPALSSPAVNSCSPASRSFAPCFLCRQLLCEFCCCEVTRFCSAEWLQQRLATLNQTENKIAFQSKADHPQKLFRFCDLDLDPIIFIYELDPYGDLPVDQKWTFYRQDFRMFQSYYRQTDRQTDGIKNITTLLRGW